MAGRGRMKGKTLARFRLLGILVLAMAAFGCSWEERGEDLVAGAGIAGVSIEKLREASTYAGGSGMVLRGGEKVYQWGDVEKLYDVKSTTKSIGVVALGLAVDDGLVKLTDKAIVHFPGFGTSPAENKKSEWVDKISLFHLATHTGGFDKPGGHEKLLFEPGTAWAYSDGGPNWLADCLTHLYQRDLKDLLFERVFSPIGISQSDLKWRENWYREKTLGGIPRREFGSGIHANVKAMALIGQLFLQGGNWDGRPIVSKGFVDIVRKPIASIVDLPVRNDKESEFAEASRHLAGNRVLCRR